VRRLLRHREFRLLFLGQTASTVGDQVVIVALALYVTQIGSPTDVGLVLAAHTVPLVALILFGGVWADRLPRHRLMLAADGVRGAVHALLAVLILAGSVHVWEIVVIEAVFGSAEAFFRPAYTGLIPQTVPAEELQPAKAATNLVETVAGFLGPALATALVVGVGAGWAFAVDAATFVVSALFLIPMRPPRRGEATAPASMLVDLREGWSAVRARPWVWITIAAFSFELLCSFGPWQTLGPTIAEQVHGRRAVFGVLVAAQGAGTLLGSLAGFRLRPAHPLRLGIALVLLAPTTTLAFALGAPVAALLPLYVLTGAGIALFIVWWETALAQRVPAHLLSRVTAYDWMGSLGLMPIGLIAAGPLAAALGARAVLAGGAMIGLVALTIALLSREVRALAD
jgi:predicted MFS family arabinose efflux permease